MKRKKHLYGFIIGMTLIVVTACSPKKDNSNTTSPGNSQQEITSPDDSKESENTNTMDEFNKLISKEESSLKDIATFMNENIADATQEEATTMILRFEELQNNKKTVEEEKYLPEDIQKSFNTLGSEGVDFNKTDSIKDETIKKLVLETKENGYKVETAEGFYFPVIDYSFYKQFSTYATPDIKEYINLMIIESDEIFARDASLVIGWNEVVNRALSYEKFLNQYPDSERTLDIEELYKRYETITMYGLNNTPLFAYETNIMEEKAKDAYSIALAQSINSNYLKNLGEFMEIVRRNDNKLTDEVDKYRKSNTSNGNIETSKDPNRYYVAGIDEADEFDTTFEMLRTALAENDKDTFADYIAYPIKVNIDGKRVDIKDKDEFIKNFDKIITGDVKTAFLNQKIEEFFVNAEGIMVGDGQFWFSQIAGTKHKFSIYAINN